ncbi:MAG: glycosyltransferase [Candidatus Thalassarchaeaceae archaeon]|jgi:GT2 family glycosyltransferase|nr:glycosyltransferase [Candidatus Thalassarchaeaceae archaeon]MDP6703376.1 glycosyltransferase [Candidatus Thalassarchaeaceae archaeon]MDP7003428.1 glycosyltransferase [Candidatus Thalassarchaeaceae archaeon]
MVASVCVIVPTIRNAEELGIALDGLVRQTHPEVEVIVVGPAKDPGRRVAESKGLVYLDDKGSRTRADACNIAIQATESDLVLFTDDDVIVPEDWVSNLVRWFDRPEVAGVGGPNFAPPESSTLWQRVIDVSFCNRLFTAGTNYGRQAKGSLEEVEQIPGVNSAYRRPLLEEVGGFDSGAIGAEDVILDHRIRAAGHKLWSDGNAVMWHRRRGLVRVKSQIRNYGLVRTLAGKEYPGLWGWSHILVSAFPPLVLLSFSLFFWGALNGGLAWPEFWDISAEAAPMGPERIAAHQLPTLAILYNLLAWLGAASGSSPNRSPVTVFLSSLVTYMLHWNYGMGVLQGRWRIATGRSGLQIDDRGRE